MKSNSKAFLFTCYFSQKDERRKAELIFCLQQNLKNESIEKVFVLMESGYSDLILLTHTKLILIKTVNRPQISDLIKLSNDVESGERIKIIANSDIFFDDSIEFIKKDLMKNYVYCLTRWDYKEDGKHIFYNNFKSQDAWFFMDKLPPKIGNFYLGVPGCDNRFAKELKDRGYTVENPSLTVKAIHVHRSNQRSYDKIKDKVKGPYAYPLPKELNSYKTIWGQRIKWELKKQFLYRKWRNNLEGVNFNIFERYLARIYLFYVNMRNK